MSGAELSRDLSQSSKVVKETPTVKADAGLQYKQLEIRGKGNRKGYTPDNFLGHCRTQNLHAHTHKKKPCKMKSIKLTIKIIHHPIA